MTSPRTGPPTWTLRVRKPAKGLEPSASSATPAVALSCIATPRTAAAAGDVKLLTGRGDRLVITNSCFIYVSLLVDVLFLLRSYWSNRPLPWGPWVFRCRWVKSAGQRH